MDATRPFAAWSDFYVIVGSSAAALTGLQFVAIVLSAELGIGTAPTTRAFATPTVVHFCTVLAVSALMAAPWPLAVLAAVLIAWGFAGALYVGATVRRTRSQRDYVPVFEDWLWHAILPFAGYGALAAAGGLAYARSVAAAPAAGATALLMLFVGIHNAWDAVTYIAHRGRERQQRDDHGSA